MSVSMGWLARSRLRPRSASEAHRLIQPLSTLIIGAVVTVVILGIAIVSNVYPNKTTTIYTTLGFIAFASLGPLLIAVYYLDWHEMSDRGLHYAKWWGGRGRLEWTEVVGVRYSPWLNWFRIETQSGGVARLSTMLVGLPELADLVLTHVQPQAISQETRSILQKTASGSRPPIGR